MRILFAEAQTFGLISIIKILVPVDSQLERNGFQLIYKSTADLCYHIHAHLLAIVNSFSTLVVFICILYLWLVDTSHRFVCNCSILGCRSFVCHFALIRIQRMVCTVTLFCILLMGELLLNVKTLMVYL